MSEDLRSQIPTPTLYQDQAHNAQMHALPAVQEAIRSTYREMVPVINIDTLNSPLKAEKVAEAVHPDVDAVASAQIEIDEHAPNEHAVEIKNKDGKLIGYEGDDVADQLLLKKQAAEVDLERNITKATELAAPKRLGKHVVRHSSSRAA